MNLFTLFAKLGLDTTEYDNKVDESTKKGKELGNTLGTKLASAAKIGAQAIMAAATAAGAAVAGLAKVGIEYNAQIETYTMGLTTLLGSAEEAQKAIENIKQDAARTPFDVASLVQANQLLIGAGVSADDARATIIALGDAISATGGGSAELARMAANLQQAKNVGQVTSMDIKQFAMAGINIYKVLADYLGVSTAEVQNMTVGYDELSAALIKAAGAGGMFEGSMQRQSQTFNGIMATLQDNVKALIGEVFQPLSTKLVNEILPQANEYIQQLGEAYEKGGTTVMIKAAGEILSKVIDFIISSAPDLIDGTLVLLDSLADGVIANIPKFAMLLVQMVSKLAKTLTSPELVKKIVTALVMLLGSLATELGKELPSLVETLIRNVIDILTSLLGGELFDSLIDAFGSVSLALTEALTNIDWAYVFEKLSTGLSAGVSKLLYKVIQPLAHTIGYNMEGMSAEETDAAFYQYFDDVDKEVEARARARKGLAPETMPTETIKSAVGGALGGSRQTTVVLEVDGKALGAVTYEESEKIKQKYGTTIVKGATQ